MYQDDAEVLFPARVVPMLRHLRGESWQQLVAHVMALPENHPDSLAFNLLMIRLGGCLSCHADSYRAMRGCTVCAQQTAARFKGSDEDLLTQWEQARAEVRRWIDVGEAPML
jgi:hypothetical protein